MGGGRNVTPLDLTNPLSLAEHHQRLAADPAASVFVTANAGSGKTKVLIDRVARLLLAGGAPSSFLCITYTKAAAAEMQRRLFQRLGQWCVADDASLSKDLAALGEADWSSQRALSHARRQFARALETPGGLRIQTIHAFCERLLGRFPLEAGVPPGFEIADEVLQAQLLSQAWSRAAEAQTVADALERLCGRVDAKSFEGLLQRLAEKRAALAEAVGGDLAAAAQRILHRHQALDATPALEAEGLRRAPWSDLEAIADLLRGDGGAKNLAAAERIAAALRDRSGYPAYRDVFLKEDGGPHQASPAKKIRSTHAFLGALFESEAARLMDLEARIRARERAEDSIAALILGEAIAREYKEAKERAGALDFEDLIHAAKHLLRDRPAAAWVLYKLDGGIDHILIDEGQDTSPEQWALLEPLQAEFFAGAGARGEAQRTVFAVGDPKQSIYSFQGADPARFLRQARDLDLRATAAGRRFTAPTLAMSFRSSAEVLEAVDAVFAGVAFAKDAPEAMGDKTVHTAHRVGQTGLVEWWPHAPKPDLREAKPWDAPLDQEEAEAAPARLARGIARTVRDWIDEGQAVWDRGALRPMRPGDVLVLVKKRGAVFRAVLRALKREGLAVAGADRITLSEELAVQDLLALARVALDPGDDLALACVLKSPLVGLMDDDQDLFPLAHGRRRGERLIDRLQASAEPRHRKAAAFVAGVIDRKDAAPFAFFADALEQLDENGDSGWRRMAERLGPEARDPLEELLARALAAPAQGLGHLWAFLAAMEQDESSIKREGEEEGPSIRVMTVHGAKGLEAPVVFLAETAAGPGDGPREGLFLAPDGPLWSPSAKQDDAIAAALRAERAEREAQEHLRLLYVALTRARDRLIVCGHARGAGEGAPHEESWHARVGAALERIGRPADTPFGKGWRLGQRLTAPSRAKPASLAFAFAPDWMLQRPATAPPPAPAMPRAGLSPRRADRARFRRGQLIHGLLQRLPDAPAAERPTLGLRWLARQGVTDADAEALLQEALAVIAHPDCAAAFGPGSRAEQPILGAGVKGVADRVLIGPQTVWIIDFKTDRPAPTRIEDADPAYLAQIRGYAAALAAALPGRAMRCSLIWTEAPRVMAVPLDDRSPLG